MTAGQQPSQDDELLYDAYDRFLEARFEGRELDPATVHPGRKDLQDSIAAVSQLADEVMGAQSAAPPQLADYSILRELGHGGMGSVYLARQEKLGRDVALKVLPRSVALSRRARRRFLDEARALASLRDDHIVAVHDVLDQDDVLAYAIRFPLLLLVAFGAIALYFRTRGGYKPIELDTR